MNPDLTRELCETYTGLLCVKSINCGDGWYPLIDTLCGFLVGFGVLSPAVYEIGEDRGQLLFRVRGENAASRAYVEFAERLSETICELCGRPSTVAWGDEGKRQTTRCSECASRAFSSVASELFDILREGLSDHELTTKVGAFLADKAKTIEGDIDGFPAEVGPKEKRRPKSESFFQVFAEAAPTSGQDQ